MSKYLVQGTRRTWSHGCTVFPYDCSNVFCVINSAHVKQNCFVIRILYPQFIHPYLKILNAKDSSKRVQ